jgi:arginine/lysine/histidine transporter system substrate-binding protein
MRSSIRCAARIAAAVVLLALLFALVGCNSAPTQKVEPKVGPPAVSESGKLKVGVDLTYPPFGGTDGDKQAGIDVDVASALASKLGVEAVIVDVKPSDAATALADGKVDAVLSVPYSEDSLARVTLAGSYLSDGPAFFIATDSTASVVPSLTLDTITVAKVGAQEGSPAFWKLQSEFGSDSVVGFPTLREALNALREEKVKVTGGDAAVSAYIVRDMPTVHFAGQIEPAVPLGVAVKLDNTQLGDAIRGALDQLSADGVLDTIRAKWLGALPKLELPESTDASAGVEASASIGATPTP